MAITEQLSLFYAMVRKSQIDGLGVNLEGGAMLTTFELRRRIAQLNRLDPRRAGYQAIASTYANMTSGIVSRINASGAEVYFRARVNMPERPKRLSELGPPPAEYVSGYQRCNPPGIPMFYTASRRVTALLECRVTPGDIVYLSQWMGKRALIVNTSLTDFCGSDREYDIDERNRIFYTYFDTIFTRRVHSDFSDDYKFTAAISQQFTANYHKSWDDIPDDGKIGFQYPSVVDIERSYNTVFHGSAFAEFEPLHVAELKIVESSESSISAELLANAVSFPNGEIVWTDDLGQIPAFRPSHKMWVATVWSGEEWRVDVHGREMARDEFHKFLNE